VEGIATNEPLTPEQARVKAIAELMAMPGPRPLKPIPPEVKAAVLAEFELESEEEVARQVEELRKSGGVSIDQLIEELERRLQAKR
jgi:hypothetical protein